MTMEEHCVPPAGTSARQRKEASEYARYLLARSALSQKRLPIVIARLSGRPAPAGEYCRALAISSRW